MKIFKRKLLPAAITAVLIGVPSLAGAVAVVQCPEDIDGDGNLSNNVDIANVKCQHLTGGDGFITMADGRELYIFSFSDVSNHPASEVLDVGVFRANSPAPTIVTKEGEELYLTLTNVGTFNRPDLFDPHTVHYHGFPNASAIFDGLPESAVSINQQASITYYYNNVEPGTYMFHCHVEATEHMQMGMLGNLYVEPAQNDSPPANSECAGGSQCTQFVYNDGDGSTGYDVEYPIQLQAMDGDFHDASESTQPLPFAAMVDQYPTLNGRGYPDTVLSGTDYPPQASNSSCQPGETCESSQPVSSLITATQGQRVLLRLSNLGVVQHYTVTVLGIPMKVVGHGARMLRGTGQASPDNVFVDTNVVTLGGGESADVMLDTSEVAPGTYFLYATNLNYLSNNDEDFGGYMTEIVIN